MLVPNGLCTEDVIDGAAFEAGLKRCVDHPQVPVLHLLFECRSRLLGGELTPEGAAAFLSGLLIADDVGGALHLFAGCIAERTVHVIGAPRLTELYAAALAGMGITGLPSFVAADALLENALERVLPKWHLDSTTLYAGMPTRKHVPARTRAFVDFLVEIFGGEDRDPWLAAAGCPTQLSTPPKPAPRRARRAGALEGVA